MAKMPTSFWYGGRSARAIDTTSRVEVAGKNYTLVNAGLLTAWPVVCKIVEVGSLTKGAWTLKQLIRRP